MISQNRVGIGKKTKKCPHTMDFMYKQKISQTMMRKLSDTKKHKKILMHSLADSYNVVSQIDPIKLSDKSLLFI
jgi:hypothetical protein